jgi:hypothetical protein
MVLVIRKALNEDAHWLDVSGQGLHTKIQTGLTQIYWQWQGNGRANKIEYWPENIEYPFLIEMNDRGLPVVAKNVGGCVQFLYWFVDEKLLNKSVDVTTNYIETKYSINSLRNENAEDGIETAICQFEYANKVHIYDLNSGRLTFTY